MTNTPDHHHNSPLFDPHSEPLREEAPVERLVSLTSLPKDMKEKLAQERRRSSRIGAEALNTIMALNEAISRAEIDTVTGVPNRRVFQRELEGVVQRFGHEDQPEVAVFLGDLNGLKRVNEARGHVGGDEYLYESVQAIRGSMRPTDRVYRIGGDEIAMILIGTKPSEEVVGHLVDRTKRVVNEHLQMPKELYTGISIGGHLLQKGETAGDVFTAIDTELAADKSAFNSSIPRSVLEQDDRRI